MYYKDKICVVPHESCGRLGLACCTIFQHSAGIAAKTLACCYSCTKYPAWGAATAEPDSCMGCCHGCVRKWCCGVKSIAVCCSGGLGIHWAASSSADGMVCGKGKQGWMSWDCVWGSVEQCRDMDFVASCGGCTLCPRHHQYYLGEQKSLRILSILQLFMCVYPVCIAVVGEECMP
jgi:hypothetical protein